MVYVKAAQRKVHWLENFCNQKVVENVFYQSLPRWMYTFYYLFIYFKSKAAAAGKLPLRCNKKKMDVQDRKGKKNQSIQCSLGFGAPPPGRGAVGGAASPKTSY